jgi:hypothetical protein
MAVDSIRLIRIGPLTDGSTDWRNTSEEAGWSSTIRTVGFDLSATANADDAGAAIVYPEWVAWIAQLRS